MIDALLLRLEGPLMSFGTTAVDRYGPTRSLPGKSMLTGLLANALGWEHGDAERLQHLQQALRFAARLDRPGEEILDFQTVDLGQPQFAGPGRPPPRGRQKLLDPRAGWTTRGAPEGRSGGDANVATHIRLRRYLGDAACTVALSLAAGDALPSLQAIAAALEHPERPLFLGRKPCLPSRPVLAGTRRGPGLVAILCQEPCEAERVLAEWPADEPVGEQTGGQGGGQGGGHVEDVHELSVSDERDWHNQLHTGTRRIMSGWLRVTGPGP